MLKTSRLQNSKVNLSTKHCCCDPVALVSSPTKHLACWAIDLHGVGSFDKSKIFPSKASELSIVETDPCGLLLLLLFAELSTGGHFWTSDIMRTAAVLDAHSNDPRNPCSAHSNWHGAKGPLRLCLYLACWESASPGSLWLRHSDNSDNVNHNPYNHIL